MKKIYNTWSNYYFLYIISNYIIFIYSYTSCEFTANIYIYIYIYIKVETIMRGRYFLCWVYAPSLSLAYIGLKHGFIYNKGPFKYNLFCWKHCNKIIFKFVKNYCSLFFLLFICLGALFMSQEQCTRRWSLKKKKKKKKKKEKTHKRGRRNVDPNWAKNPNWKFSISKLLRHHLD